MFITASCKIASQKMFRLSQGKLFSRGPFGTGRSMQNWEKSKRCIVVAGKGRKIVQRDQGGADARIVAWEAPDGNFRKLFKLGIKPHCFVALRRYKHEFAKRIPERAEQFLEAASTPIEKLKALPYWKELVTIIADSDNWEHGARYYFNGKTMCHSLNYDAEASIYRDTCLKRSGGMLWLSYEEAQQDVNTYKNELFPEIFNDWQPRVLREFRQNGDVVYNLFGHPMRFTPRVRHSIKDIYAANPQSTVAEITHRAVTIVWERIQKERLDWTIFNQCHDSFALNCPEDEAVQANEEVMKPAIEAPLVSTRGEEFQMLSSGMIGDNWGPWHKDKNPGGLVEK